MDDKDTIRDILNCLLGLDNDHEIIDLDYEFEKPIDVFMPEDDSARLDVWVTTKDNRYFNIVATPSFGIACNFTIPTKHCVANTNITGQRISN